MDALSNFLTYFGLDVSSLPAPIVAVLACLLLFLVLGIICDYVASFRRR